jgi:CBS domain-containing protein
VGEHRVTAYQDTEQLRFFMKCVLRDLQALEEMLDQGMIESDKSRVGAEQELFLVDRSGRPAMLAPELLERVDDPHFTTELARFNLEFNLDPFEFRGSCLRDLQLHLEELLGRARSAACELGGDVVMTGILPTLRKDDLGLEAMTPLPRYFALKEAMGRLRGGVFRLRIKGTDELNVQHDTMMLEACNTSFQVHLQVAPEDFVRLYNVAQLIAAPVTAAAVNSPLLFGKRLWAETRLALFQQSVDTRKTDLHQRQFMPRVSFGSEWVKKSVLEIYQEDVARFRALIGTEEYEDPYEAMAAGRAPKLFAMRLHTGTVYRWNRACYGISDGKPHLRIENRLLPAGPSVIDEVANAAFWFGLVHGGAAEWGDPAARFSFDDARGNLLAAARLGLDAQFAWLDEQRLPAGELILGQLLPVARQGLDACGIDPADSERYLRVVQQRVESGRTGAAWQVKSFTSMDPKASPMARAAALVQASIENQTAGRPGHEWAPAECCPEVELASEHYQQVESFMTTDIFTVHEDELVDLAANMMDWRHIRHVPVEDDEHRLVGLVTHRALLRFFSRAEGERRQVPVGEIMERDPVTVAADARTLDAFRLMREHQVSCLPVVDADRHLVGLVTDHDFMGVAAQLLEQKLRE